MCGARIGVGVLFGDVGELGKEAGGHADMHGKRRHAGVGNICWRNRVEVREEGAGERFLFGGAVLTADYVARIGADYYSKDAAATVRAAKEVYGRN